MENNKILIGVQFTKTDSKGKFKHINIELYVVRDITLIQLLDGIKYGLTRLARAPGPNQEIYGNCLDVFSSCISNMAQDEHGATYFPNITFTSYRITLANRRSAKQKRFIFSIFDVNQPLCELGFITSSRIIFDESGELEPRGILDTRRIIDAFNPEVSDRLFFPEYNISTRQLYKFDNTGIRIIPPSDPPKKPTRGLFYMLFPPLVTMGTLMLVRILMMQGHSGSGFSMIAMSAAMIVSSVLSTLLSWKKQKKEYAENLQHWRTEYEAYIDSLMEQIRIRQKRDTEKLEELYPDMLTLISPDQDGIYTVNENIYSRARQDDDFLAFRIGHSDNVLSKFPILGEGKDVIFSQASFCLQKDQAGNEHVKMVLREEQKKSDISYENLTNLPAVISKEYECLKNAPLIYSLKNKGALGIVDSHVGAVDSNSSYFISRMIFELCYYHSPEDLQFVVFFEKEKDWNKIERRISPYKFMPHFHGLFSDKSQFIFDESNAALVMSNLLSIMSARSKTEKGSAQLPHIVMVVFEEHGLKEHAFAEYLPKVPENGQPFENSLGLSFVFVKKYKEYLPAYCDDIVCFGADTMTLTPRENVKKRMTFRYDQRDQHDNQYGFMADYLKQSMYAFQFFSSIYYAQIAQNGKVPSSVSMFELMEGKGEKLNDVICANWGIGAARKIPGVTKSLKVPVGKTDNGIAYLDLHEKADGPHMLVAGTTGSGKTETIISYLLGLCMQFRPDELNLMLVDMKGGGFTKRIGHLPHVVGTVTDVDGDENGVGATYMLSRFLDAMKAEIKQRKILFNQMHVDSLDGYIKACDRIEEHIVKKKVGKSEADQMRRLATEERRAHLILVVDEFTELKRFTSENSDVDFMGEITTIARVGRSLGFHIILISQNIEGAITDDIRVNSNARLCLKVATKQASKDMIGTELAASPLMPGYGRAYLLVGTGSKFEYFQSAYSGAGTHEAIPIEITLASKTGMYSSFYRSDRDNVQQMNEEERLKRSGQNLSQLEVICDAICSAYATNQEKMPKPHIVFRKPLGRCLTWDAENQRPMDLGAQKAKS